MKYLKFLISPVLMGVLFVVFALAMAVATFLENDFGSPAAYSMVYNSIWFELILLLLTVNLVGQIVVFKLYKKAKLPGALFHISFIIMILGAGITRYFGWEGSIHIREGEEQNICYSSEKYMGFSTKDNQGNVFSGPMKKYSMTSVSADKYKDKVKVNNKEYDLVLSKIIPNASEVISDIPGGEPIISLLITKDMTTRETIILKNGELKSSSGLSIGFNSPTPADLNIFIGSEGFYAKSDLELGEMSMTHQTVIPVEKGKSIQLKEMQVISVNDIKVVPQTMSVAGIIKVVSVNSKEEVTDQNAFIFHLTSGNESETIYLWDKGTESSAKGSCTIDGTTVTVSYGAKETILPFSLKLNDFILERYPGSSSPSGYKSDVVLLDKSAGVEKPFMIFMNNILKYKGYRQSRYGRNVYYLYRLYNAFHICNSFTNK
jgi:hypothetical protein